MTKARDLANAGTALGAVTATELAFVDGVTSAIQTQIDAKAPSSTAVTLTGTQTLTNKTLTNPVIASVVNNTLTTTTGDMIYASAANTPARLGIGSTDQVLKVTAGVPAWATPAAGGMTQLATGTFSGSSVSITSISSAYRDLKLVVRNYKPSQDGEDLRMRLNQNTGQIYAQKLTTTTSRTSQQFNAASAYFPLVETQDNTAANGLMVLDIPDYANTTTWKWWIAVGISNNSSIPGNYNLKWDWGGYDQTGAINEIEIYVGGGTFTSGDYYLYGVK
jgi:hypothetical protein